MYYGFDIGGTKIEFGAFDKDLNRVVTQRVTTPTNNYAQLIDTIVELVTFYDREFSICGSIGLGIPGIENAVNGEVTTVNIPAANGRKLSSDLIEKLNRPVCIENDANCFALSEAIDVKERHCPSVLGLILGTGFGAGIILNNQVFKGRNNLAGEFGHMRLPVDAWNLLGDNAPSFPCGCGKYGCLDNYLSGRGFESLYQHYYMEHIDAKDIIANAERGDKNSVEFVDMFLELTSICFANIFTAWDPDRVVLGGGLSNFELFYDELPKRISKYMLTESISLPSIEKAKFGDASGVRGAAFLNISL